MRSARSLQACAAWTVALLLLCGRAEPAQPRAPEAEVTNAPVRRVIWRDPGPVGKLDLSWRSDSARRPPAPPFRFVAEDNSGTRPKIVVTDSDGVEWNVKLADDGEAHAEVAAARLTWALGYFVEESYYVAEGTVENIGKLRRAARMIGPDGSFSAARFEKRSPDIVRVEERWSFDRNPFVGQQELSGLAILMTMLNNWDLGGTRNTRVIQVAGENGPEYRYLISDLGASFGRMGNGAVITRRNKWSLRDFQEQAFIDGTTNGMLDLHFSGDGAINLVPIDHARWFDALLSQLTDEQIRQAFEAAGATVEEIDGFSTRLREKIDELANAISS